MAKKKSMYEVGDIVETQTTNGLVKGVVEKKLYAELNPPVWIYTIKGKLADGTPYMANSVREEDIISIKNQTNMSIKDKKGAYEFKNSNLRFHGMKMDINGNPCFVLSTPNERAFCIQQDPAYTIYWELGQSGESIVEKNYKDSNDFEKYIVDYIKKFGSKKQKSNLHVYNEENRKIGFYTDNKGNKAVYTMSYDESDNECELTKVKDGKKTLVARTKIFSNGKITTSYKGGYDLENCDELHKDYLDFVEKHIKKGNNFACGKGNFGFSTYSWEDSGFTEQEKEDLINGKLKCYYVSAIDKSMSGWGGAKGGNSKIIVICWSNMQMHKCVEALESKKYFKNITWGYGFPKNITNYAHCQIYNFDDCYDWNRGYFGSRNGESVYIGSNYENDLIGNKIIPHKSKWIIKADGRNWNVVKAINGQNVYLPTESFKKRLKNQFSIIDDTKDVLRAGGKLAGNVVKDTLYNGGILMF